MLLPVPDLLGVPVQLGLSVVSDDGETDRGVEIEGAGVLSGENVGAMTPRIRPAAKTQPPTAWRIRESPARLPMMKTFLATSREDSAFGRSVRPEIRDEEERVEES